MISDATYKLNEYMKAFPDHEKRKEEAKNEEKKRRHEEKERIKLEQQRERERNRKQPKEAGKLILEEDGSKAS